MSCECENKNEDLKSINKLPKEYENPIDYIVYTYLCEYTAFIFYNFGITPNMITTLSLITGLLSTVYIESNNYVISILLLWISYYFDCLDGHVARKYKQCSPFGCYYDHIKDNITMVYIIYTLSYKLQTMSQLIFFYSSILLFSFGLAIQLGMQEIYSKNENKSSSLSILMMLCKNSLWEFPESFLNYTKYLGCGTFYVLITTIIGYCYVIKQENYIFM